MNNDRIPLPELTKLLKGPFFCFVCDAASKIVHANPSLEGVLGTPTDGVVGRHYSGVFGELIPETDKKCADGEKNCPQQKRLVRDAEGNLRVLKVHFFDQNDSEGNLLGRLGLVEDVTAAHATEEKINQRLGQIESEIESLSVREQRVLDLVLRGELNKSIARELEISERAVERIRSRVSRKYSVDSTAQLVVKAAELNLLRWILNDESSDPLLSKKELKSPNAEKGSSSKDSILKS